MTNYMDITQIDYRVKVEGKDLVDRFSTERENFIRDTCIELSTAFEFSWLEETKTLTYSTDWIDLWTDMHHVEAVSLVPDGVDKAHFFERIKERDVTYKAAQIASGQLVGYRLRWNEDTRVWQLKIVNGPTSSTNTINVLILKYLESPEKFPNQAEEAIVRGAVARFSAFLEGDDLPYAEQQYARFIGLGKQLYSMGDLVKSSGPGSQRRVKTQAEIDDERSRNKYPVSR